MRDIDDYTRKYTVANFEDYQLQYRRKKILETLNSGKFNHNSILELGCGEEPLFKYLKDDFFSHYLVIEPSTRFYNSALKKKGEDDRISIINGSFPGDFHLYNYRFDVIICSCLLHEIEDQKTFLKALYKICGKNTIVHINVPNAYSFHRVLATNMGIISDEHKLSHRNMIYQQHNVFDMEQLKGICVENGFVIKESGSYFIKPFTHDQMYKMIECGIIDEKVLDGLYKLGDIFDCGSEIFVNIQKKD